MHWLQRMCQARSMLENFGSVRDQMPPSGVLCLLKLPQQAKSLTLNLLKFNPERRPSAEVALQEAEPVCDKVIRMPIADMTKLKASDYREVVRGTACEGRALDIWMLPQAATKMDHSSCGATRAVLLRHHALQSEANL
mmetsp:Transcript_1151/g.2544  ORF Transcript_1151/g.2544 Transcript_1151/m.2544 type:complete len:138 (+) Transcript_1151:122-535(+)